MRYIVLCLCLGLQNLFAQQVVRTIQRLPDTGQQKSYTVTPGEDADYNINPPMLIKNADGTVTDSVTGLMWTAADGGEMTFDNARNWAKNLRTGGYSDWRLPNPLESFTILNLDLTNPALDLTKFASTTSEYWYTNLIQAGDTTKVWVTNAGGGIGNHPKKETISAGGNKIFAPRAVRSLYPDQVITDRFSLQKNGLIFDSLTDLVWKTYTVADSLNWEDALKLADTSTAGGYSDWRLPNMKELMSLTDYTITNPALSRKVFVQLGNIHIWSSTSLPNQPARAWYLDTKFGITTYADKTAKLPVFLVRNTNNVSTGVTQPKNQSNPWIPNPFRDYLYYNSAAVIIMDAQGKNIYSGAINMQIYTGNWPMGIYIISDLTNGYTRKLVHVVE